jgi:hypothetical protein
VFTVGPLYSVDLDFGKNKNGEYQSILKTTIHNETPEIHSHHLLLSIGLFQENQLIDVQELKDKKNIYFNYPTKGKYYSMIFTQNNEEYLYYSKKSKELEVKEDLIGPENKPSIPKITIKDTVYQNAIINIDFQFENDLDKIEKNNWIGLFRKNEKNHVNFQYIEQDIYGTKQLM